jgi:hypothetical protein
LMRRTAFAMAALIISPAASIRSRRTNRVFPF